MSNKSNDVPPFHRMPWYPRDFRSSTLGWPLVARAVYRELLDAQWDAGGPNVGTLPEDEEGLRYLVGATPAEWKVAWRLLESKFPIVQGGGRRNARLEVHRQASVTQYMKRRNGADKTNQQRWGKARANGNGHDHASDIASDS